MNIALIGYGKMGKVIEEIAVERGHTISAIVNSNNPIDKADLSDTDVAIEFTQPDLAIGHIELCFKHGIPIVVGTTGWHKSLDEIEEMTIERSGSLLHASNFSIGVNVFFEVNKRLAELISGKEAYSASLEETHHTQKLDAPSGTAITLANGILENNADYSSWVHGKEIKPYFVEHQLPVISYRKPDVPGTHVITYASEIDTITLTHEAHNRKGFALGAVISAEWIVGKKGVFTIKDVLNL